MAKPSPGEFVRQVRQEAGKITWPTRKETVQGAIMVLIMVAILSAFFTVVDAVLGFGVKGLLTLLSGN